MKKILKTKPAVFAVGDFYQIIVPVTKETVMWVRRLIRKRIILQVVVLFLIKEILKLFLMMKIK